MKKVVLVGVALAMICSGCEYLPDDFKLTEEEVVDGLRMALTKGAEVAGTSASAEDGFWDNPLDPSIRIPLPSQAETVVEAIDDINAALRGMNPILQIGVHALFPNLVKQLDDAVNLEKTINRASEKASETATRIFVAAITGMTVQEGFNILNGGNRAATDYLDRTTRPILVDEFLPIVNTAIESVGLTAIWEPLADIYNHFVNANLISGEIVDKNLGDYVTGKAIDGLMNLVAGQELKIRQDPLGQAEELLRKVFGSI